MTMIGALTGRVYGDTRVEVIAKAKELASAYFGELPECIKVRLTSEEVDAHRMVYANFEAGVWHDLETPVRGPSKCKHCDQLSWPHNPLNVIREFN